MEEQGYFVYVIFSHVLDCYYKGFSENPGARLIQHNSGQSKFTSKSNDWKLVFLEKFESKKEALTREKVMKKYSKSQMNYLINSDRNYLKKG